MILFLDTEFTGLGQRWPRLISIGLVSEDGRHSFYAELAPEGYMDKCTPWVRANVLPLLQGGECVMEPDELRQRLAEWIGTLGSARIVTDAPDFDFKFMESMLTPWRENIDRKPIRFNNRCLGEQHREAVEIYRAAYFTPAKPEHHALDDAKANRLAWFGHRWRP